MGRQSLRAPLISALLVCSCATSAAAQNGWGVEGGAPAGGVQVNIQVSTGPAQAAARDGLIRALGSIDVTTRVEAVRALGELRDPATVPALSQALSADPSPIVRGWLLRALGQINTAEARAAIAAVVRTDADERVRALALALVPQAQPAPRVGTPLAPALVQPAEYRAISAPQAPAERPRRPGRGLRVSGWVIFASTYGLCFIQGMIGAMIEPEATWPLMLPFVGPAISGTRVMQDGDDLAFLGVMGWLSAALQTAGFAMALVGHVRGRRARLEQATGRSFALLPGGGADHFGLAAVGRF